MVKIVIRNANKKQIWRKKISRGVKLYKIRINSVIALNSTHILQTFISHEAFPIHICHWQRYVWFWQGVDETKWHKSTSTRYHAIKLYENSFQSLKHTQCYTKNIFIHSISSISRLFFLIYGIDSSKCITFNFIIKS